MKKILLVTLALTTAFATAPAAKADTAYIYFSGPAVPVNVPSIGSSGGPAISGSGTLTLGTEIGNTGDFIVSNGTLSVDISGLGTYTATLLPTGSNTNGNFTFDNVLYNSAPLVDDEGFVFTLSGGVGGNSLNGDLFGFWLNDTAPYNVVYPNEVVWDVTPNVAGGNWLITNGAGGDPLNLSEAPEPSSLLLFGTGLLCMAGFLCRKALPGVN